MKKDDAAERREAKREPKIMIIIPVFVYSETRLLRICSWYRVPKHCKGRKARAEVKPARGVGRKGEDGVGD